MLFTVENRRFEFVKASCVGTQVPKTNSQGYEMPDGMAWELWEHIDGEWNLIVEIFRNDSLKKIGFETFKVIAIPFAALEVVLNDFNTNGGKDFHTYPNEE